jgi:hypothetical protein
MPLSASEIGLSHGTTKSLHALDLPRRQAQRGSQAKGWKSGRVARRCRPLRALPQPELSYRDEDRRPARASENLQAERRSRDRASQAPARAAGGASIMNLLIWIGLTAIVFGIVGIFIGEMITLSIIDIKDEPQGDAP